MKQENLIGAADGELKADQKKMPVSSPAPEKVIRVFRPKVDLKICEGNYHCLVACPFGAIEKSDKGKIQINYDLCTGCLICLRECPRNAISEEREQK